MIGPRAMERGSDFLQDVFRLALTSSSIESNRTEGPERDQLDHRRKLVEGIRFSRRFVPSYHVTIWMIILVLSTIHWTNQFIRWRRRRTKPRNPQNECHTPYTQATNPAGYQLDIKYSPVQDDGEISTASSGSSAVQGTFSPPRKIEDDEETPLLLGDANAFRPNGFRRTPLSILRSSLMYQPPPIPYLNKVLPQNGTSLAIVAFIGLNIFYIFYRMDLEIQLSFVLSDRIGLLFAANLPYLYILAAKNQPLKVLTGQSYESLNLFHRRLGELLCLQALVHSVGMVIAWYFIIRPLGLRFVGFVLTKFIIYGIIAFLSYELLYVTSLASFRQRWYELFLGLHVLLQVCALLFLYLHHPGGRRPVLAALAIFLVDRLVYRVGLKRTTTNSQATIMEDDETIKLSMNIILRHSGMFSRIFGKSISNGWQATDHVFVTIPSLGPEHTLQAHPFTIASQAPVSGDEEATLDLLIRARDGFSANLLMRARSHRQLSVRLDGPYGSPHARQILEDTDLALMIAGGSGIAVIWPLVQHLLDICGSSDPENTTTLLVRKQSIVVVWVIHKGEHIDWIGRRVLADAENRGVQIIIPRATEEIGRPNLHGILDQITRESLGASGGNAKIGVVASGPDSMGRQVRNICASMVRDGLDVDVTVEKFGW